MRVPRTLSVAIAACAALTLGATAAPAADTPAGQTVHETAEAKAAPAPALRGIGRQVAPLRDTGIYSGPGLSTPRVGTAWAGDNVAAICQTKDNVGNRMVLAIDRPGRNGVQWANTAGYVMDWDIVGRTDDLSQCDGYGIGLRPIETAMYSGPGLSTPRIGTTWLYDDVGGICKIKDNVGNWMVLGINRPGRNGVQWANTAGYIWGGHIRGAYERLEECGTA